MLVCKRPGYHIYNVNISVLSWEITKKTWGLHDCMTASLVSLRCSAEDKNKLTDWLFICRNWNFEIKSRGPHTR